ncbi:MAG: hypothetical protein R2736_06950 [Solirubrobacterales bacterium]
MVFSVVEVVAYGGVVLVATAFGLTAVAAAVSGFQVLSLCAAYAVMLGPMVGVPLRQLVRDVGPARHLVGGAGRRRLAGGPGMDGILPALAFRGGGDARRGRRLRGRPAPRRRVQLGPTWRCWPAACWAGGARQVVAVAGRVAAAHGAPLEPAGIRR